jgi:hypothetical protein
MEPDRRGCIVQPSSRANRQREDLVIKAKPFDIPKREVWKAFKHVKANQGAAGVDGESIAEFEADLSNNLYKLWNRLSSGSYFPPPVRRVMAWTSFMIAILTSRSSAHSMCASIKSSSG